jgi:hypothetical protein
MRVWTRLDNRQYIKDIFLGWRSTSEGCEAKGMDQLDLLC